ncbi:MAG TPA: type II secretion system secretin GspD [Polyangiaceae bacterium]|nr:type II secretion system secretin GspD [Polyangiaceae bacterium]
MTTQLLRTSIPCLFAISLIAADARAQKVRTLGQPAPGAAQPVAPQAGQPVTGGTPGAAGAPGIPGVPPGAAGIGTTDAGTPGVKLGTGPGGKPQADTQGLQQFESGVDYQPRPAGDKVSFSLEDADLPELVRVIGELTGKRFIFGGKVHNIKATVFSPQKVTVAEAYQAFLSILEANGLTVVPHGRFYKIVDSPDAKMGAPVYVAGQTATGEDRYITRIHRLRNANAEDIANVLGHFKSKDGDITVYGPGNLLIITDTGTNIQRMMRILEDTDVGGIGDQIWIEPVHYGIASDVTARLNEVFDLKAGAKPGEKGAPTLSGDVHVTKIIADDRSNSIVIIGTERAYLRILEFIKRLDVPHTGEGEIHVLLLQHADATELAKTLNEIVTGAASAGGPGAQAKPGSVPLTIFESGVKVSADKATNSIVITSSLRDFANLRTVIDQLDQPRRQVFIEAVIMDLTIRRDNQLGVAFHAGDIENGPTSSGQTLFYGGLNPLASILPPGTAPNGPSLQAFAFGIRGPDLPGSSNLLGTGISIPAFGTLIGALSSTNDADILSTPHILATDNVPAEISVGQNIPLQTNSGGIGLPTGAAGAGASGLGALGALGGFGGFGGFTAPRQDIGTKIKIVPHLNDSDEVRLEVSEEISDVAGQAQGTLGVIPFSKRTAQTQLVVKDQQTVVIGGLVRNFISRNDQKIPLLGDIPVLGALFRSRTSSMQKANLILVLTPYIVREQADLRGVFERKMQERQEFLDHYFVFSDQTDYEPPKDYSRTNGLLEDIRESYADLEERRHLEELTKPREIKTHEPGQPLELAAPVGAPAPGAAPAAPGAPPAAAPPPNLPPPPPPGLNIQPPARNIEKIEK